MLDSAVDADGDTVPDRVIVNDSVPLVTPVEGDPVPPALDGPTVTVATDELVNRYVEVATDGPLEEDQPLMREDELLDKAVDEVVPVCASEMVVTMTVPFTTLVTLWADAVVPAGEVTADVRVSVTFVGVPDGKLDTVVSETEEDGAVEEVAFQPRDDD